MTSTSYISANSPSQFPLNAQLMGIITSAIIHVVVILLLILVSVYKMVPPQQIIQVDLIQIESSSIDAPKAAKPITAAKVNSAQNKISRVSILKPSTVQKDVSTVSEQPDTITTALPAERLIVATSSTLEVAGSTNREIQSDSNIKASMTSKTDGRDTAETQFGYMGAPTFIHREVPVYPLLARRLSKEGKVILQLLIDMNGNLQNVEVVEPAGFGFTEAAVAAVKNSTYSAACYNSEKITAKALLTVRFQLQ